MAFFRKQVLNLVVFLTGTAVLIVEVTATRILSPYFGNTIYTVSSVIGVVLAALSLGYYFGGRFADSHPKSSWFYGIILSGGLSTLLLLVLMIFYLPAAGYQFSLVSGPLVMALLLFFLPSFLLGTLSPFAIKLQELRLPEYGIGRISGGVFFWSTTGSIFGSLGAGFFLIPNFGVRKIIFVVGTTLILLGIFGLAGAGLKKSIIFWMFFFSLLAVAVLAVLTFAKIDSKVVFLKDGIYERLMIFEGIYKERPTRFLMQDLSNSGAMYLESQELAFDYTKYYKIFPLFNSHVKTALAIGGGAYSIPKAMLLDLPQATVDVVEIEPGLFELGKKYFRVPDDSRLTNYIEDGRRFLADSSKKYDLIFCDVYYSVYSVSPHFVSREFFQLAKSKLNEDGIFLGNFIGSLSPSVPSLTFSEMKTFRNVFSNSYFFAVESPESLAVQNLIFVGYNSNRQIDFDFSTSKLADPLFRNLRAKLIDLRRFDLAPYREFSDDFAPVEYLTSKILQQAITKDTP